MVTSIVDSARSSSSGFTDRSERFVALVGLFLLCFKVPGFTLIPLFVVPAILLLPVTITYMRGTMQAILLGLSGFALLVGLALSATTPATLGSISSAYDFLSVVLWLLYPVVFIAFALWALSIIGPSHGFTLICAGGVTGAATMGSQLEWKGSLGVYATVGALVLARKSVVLSLLVLGISGGFSALLDARALLFFSLASAVALVLRGTRSGDFLGSHRVLSIFTLIALVVGLSSIVTSAMQGGVFGAEIAQRTLDQTADGKSVVVGGRVELSATTELFATRPVGYGVGVAVEGGLQRNAVDAVQSVGGDYTSSYFTSVVLGQRTDLHSGISNGWYYFGVGGILLALFYLAVMTLAMPDALTSRSLMGISYLFSILSAMWDIFFSPMADQDRVILGLLAALTLIGTVKPNLFRLPISLSARTSE